MPMDEIGRIYGNYKLTAGFSGCKDYTYGSFCDLIIKQKLRLVKNGIIDYLILTSKEVSPPCFFMQTRKNGDTWIIEVSRNKDGRNVVYGTELPDFDRVETMFSEYLDTGAAPDVTGWDYIGEFRAFDFPDKDSDIII